MAFSSRSVPQTSFAPSFKAVIPKIPLPVQDWAGYEKYDIVVANILADVIILLVDEIPAHLKKGGYFITSGIINMKEEAVKAAFEANQELEVTEITYQGEWVSVTARKK